MSEAGPGIARDHEQSLLFEMLRVRRFEEKCAELYGAMKIRGFLHLYIGEEAVAVGALQAVGPEDAVVATYREHGHALVRGVPAGTVMAEMYGKLEGASRGRGGSMHIFDVSRRFYGGSAIVAGGIPVAVGLALADRMQGRRRITACFFGDGAVAEGAFHESMNLASLWHLPVVFICENNLYAMGTVLPRHQAETDLARKATSYAMKATAVDGMDVLAVEEAVRAATQAVRGSGDPFFVECRTYRFRAHSMFDAELYRDRREVEAWMQRDPIVVHGARLRAAGRLSDEAMAAMEREVESEIAQAVAFAEAGTLEPVERLAEDVYARARSEAKV